MRAAEHEEDEEEFVLLDLEDLFGQFDIPTNAPYTLTVRGKSTKINV